ncbi:S-layer homology domain-containing protein [Alkalibacillus aidingensis]|uniref:S-layer homology domain-containing protein n=1 Tax=Alkalibacillus aidingensis TaxID=2747607 RepID=UPI0016602BB8|nr:S-layer homology domain-containing protein [Alkalibacillus aidingensis]
MKTRFLATITISFGLLITSVHNVSAETELTDIDHLEHADAIEELVEEGIVQGHEDGTFRPDEIVQRGQYVAFLARLLDLPEGDSNFEDLPQTASLYAEVSRGVKAGIIQGTLDNKANAYDPITKSDVAVMTSRALEKHERAEDFQGRDGLAFIDDANEIGSYAEDAIAQMLKYDLMESNFKREIEPNKKMTRADATLVIARMLDLIEEDEQDSSQEQDSSDNVISRPDVEDDMLVRDDIEEFAIMDDWSYEGGELLFDGESIDYGLVDEKTLITLVNTMLDDKRWFNLNHDEMEFSDGDTYKTIRLIMASRELPAKGTGHVPFQIRYNTELDSIGTAENAFLTFSIDSLLYDAVDGDDPSEAYQQKIYDALNVFFESSVSEDMYDFIMKEHQKSSTTDYTTRERKVFGDIEVKFVPGNRNDVHFRHIE